MVRPLASLVFKILQLFFLALKIYIFNGIYIISDLVCDDHRLERFLFNFSFPSSLSTNKITRTHKKKLNSVCTGLMFTLALLAVPTAVGFPSTLSCHVAVKPTICDMLFNHEKLGTDTLLPTPNESHEYLLGSLTHTGFVCCFFCLPSEPSIFHPRVWRKFSEFTDCHYSDHHDHQKLLSPPLGPLLVHLSTASFENVLKNCCLLL